MGKKSLFRTMALVFILVVLASNSFGGPFDLYTSEALDRNRGPPKTDWYELADWEVKVCMAWGGADKVITSGVGTMKSEASLITNNRIVSIQAERSNVIPSIAKNISYEESSVYEVAWYVMPFEADDDLNYEVNLISEDGDSMLLDTGNANYYNPAKGYAANASDINFTQATIKVWNEDFNKELTVAVV